MKPRLLRSHMTDSCSWMSISFTSDGNSGIPLQFSLSCLFLPSSYEFWDYRFTIMPFLSAALDQTQSFLHVRQTFYQPFFVPMIHILIETFHFWFHSYFGI